MLQAMRRAKIPMYFDLSWSAVRLTLYAASAYGLLGIDPFEGIMYIMVAINVSAGVIVVLLALRELKKLKRGHSSKPSDARGRHDTGGGPLFIPIARRRFRTPSSFL